jgi:hypothetical protein
MCAEVCTKQMSDEEAMSGLRHALQSMTEETDGARHPELLRKLSREHPNTITILESLHPLHCYTCFVHAFGFTEMPQYVSIAQIGFNYVYASPDFAHWLCDQGRLVEVTGSDLVPNDLALYTSTDGRFRHAAIFFGSDRFQSKWGLGYLFEHRLFEVPDSYGNSARFFRGLPYAQAIRSFVCYAESKGMHFRKQSLCEDSQ